MPTQQIFYHPTTDTNRVCRDDVRKSQVVTTVGGFEITSVKGKWYISVSAGNFVVDLYLADGSHKPTGSVLSTGVVAVNTLPASGGDGTTITEISMGSYTLAAATEYCLVMRCTSTGEVGIRTLESGGDVGGGGYSGGDIYSSSNSGSTWSEAGGAMYFDIYGNTSSSNYSMSVTVGQFVLTGIDVTFTYAQHIYTMVTTVGVFTLTGVNATITSARSIAVSVGTFILTGGNAILTFVGWIFPTKHSSSVTKPTKHSSSVTKSTKHSSSVVLKSKRYH